MKRLLFISIISLLAVNSFAQNTQISNDSLNIELSERIGAIESSIIELKKGQSIIDGHIVNNSIDISTLKSEVANVESKVAANKSSLLSLEDSVTSKLSEATTAFQGRHDKLSSSMNSRSIYGCTIALFLAILTLVLYFSQRNQVLRNKNTIEAILSVQKSIQEESLKLDEKLLEIFDKQLKVQKESIISSNNEIDHSLALKVADELTRIETNLSRMDNSIRGYRQLSASVRRIKENYIANGYEIVDMLGKPYNDGMKVIANFVPDENLKEGEQVITGIVKPQINYKGQMIQAAQITVSQN